MKSSSNLPRREYRSPGPVRILRLVAMAAVIGFLLYTSWQRGQQQPAPQPGPPAGQQAGDQPIQVKVIDGLPAERKTPDAAKPVEKEPAETAPTEPIATERTATKSGPKLKTEIKGAVIRNQDGRVIFRGDIDLRETLARIERGERDDHPNDGSVFQNREKRLPKQPSGHYREWVHPTPKQRGPGPQRIVTGKNGEVYYTPDHYETFERLDK